MKNIKKIGVLTSGGDAPGMNSAIASIVKAAKFNNIEVVGIKYGYKGLLEKEVKKISLEDAISDLEERIAALEADIADISAIENQELMIERYKNRISASEAKVAILEAKVAEAKKALDAATATE